jgi:polysaccharide export outer membrane protein
MDARTAGVLKRVLAAALVFATVELARAQANNYVVGPQDVLLISLFDQPDLNGKFVVEADGTFPFPLLGRVAVGSLTLPQVESALKKRLVEGGFFKNPQISVAIEQYHSQRVFIVGEVRSPGMYPVTGDMSLIEAIARAGSTLPTAGTETLIVRSKNARADGPILPGMDSADVTRVDLNALQSGALERNVALRDGDTIFVPKAESIYVFGQVKNPGAYPLQKVTTVLQALSLAGGLTDRGASGRVRVVRLVDGKEKDVRVVLSDRVQAGDTIVVPERFF